MRLWSMLRRVVIGTCTAPVLAILSACVATLAAGLLVLANDLVHLVAAIEHGVVSQGIRTIAQGLIVIMTVGSLVAAFFPDDRLRGAVFGSSRWASRKDKIIALGKASEGLLIGRDGARGKLLRYDGVAHLLTMAPTRTGKGVGTVIPNLLTVDRSIVCIDPKGENARITARARNRFGPTRILDPFGITGLPQAAFNPLDRLDPDNPDIAEDAGTLADALVHDEPGMAGDAHWNEEARALIAGMILAIVVLEPPARRHLATLRDYLTCAPDRFATLLQRMQETTDVDGLIARAANRHLGKSDREASGVLSAAQRHTHFLDSPRMRAVLSSGDVRFDDLKRRTQTVFLVLPPDRLSTYARWLRLIVSESLIAMARTQTRRLRPVLFLLDEFAALGHLAPVETAMGLMAGYGVQLWPILQDVHQLRAIYGRRAGTFLSNAAMIQVFGVNDVETAELIGRTIGKTDAQYLTGSWSEGKSSTSEHVAARDLINPDEIMRLPADQLILLRQGERPARATKLRYFADPEFQGMFDHV